MFLACSCCKSGIHAFRPGHEAPQFHALGDTYEVSGAGLYSRWPLYAAVKPQQYLPHNTAWFTISVVFAPYSPDPCTHVRRCWHIGLCAEHLGLAMCTYPSLMHTTPAAMAVDGKTVNSSLEFMMFAYKIVACDKRYRYNDL